MSATVRAVRARVAVVHRRMGGLPAAHGDYEDEPSNMAALENGETFGELW